MAGDAARDLFFKKFHAKLEELHQPGIVLDEEEYNLICKTLEGWDYLHPADRSERNKVVGGNKPYRWAQKFAVRVEEGPSGSTAWILLRKPKERAAAKEDAPAAAEGVGPAPAVVEAQALDAFTQVLHTGNMYEALLEVHIGGGHCKSRTLENRIKAKFDRIPRWVGDLLCECCAICVQRHVRKTTML